MKQFITLTLTFVFSIIALKSYSGNNDPWVFSAKKSPADIKMLSSFILTTGGNMADGNRVVFDTQYSNAVDANDAIKIQNPGENFGLLRDQHILAVEARQPVAAGDSLFYNLGHLIPQVYKLEISAQNMASTTAHCELIDRYLNTRKLISLTDSNHLTFEVTADPASRASNRLLLVFSNSVNNNTPVKFTGISATRADKGILLQWQVVHELDVQRYEIERSSGADQFTMISAALPIYENENGGVYQYNDIIIPATDNFYRVRCINKNGVSTYSDHVKVSAPVLHTNTMTIFPNPVINNSCQVQLNNLLPGKYYIKISNNFGQQVYTSAVQVAGNSFTQTIRLDANVTKGNYNLTVWSENGIVGTQRVIVP